jgi:hypothetical protein
MILSSYLFKTAGRRINTTIIQTFTDEIPAAVIVLLIEHIAVSKPFSQLHHQPLPRNGSNWSYNPSRTVPGSLPSYTLVLPHSYKSTELTAMGPQPVHMLPFSYIH